MTQQITNEKTVAPGKWDSLTRACTGSLAIMSAGFFLIAVTQPQGLDPPPETAAIFLVSVTAASLGYLLLAHGATKAGHRVAILAGLFVILGISIVVTGVYGPGGPRTNPIGPVAWILLSVAVMVSGILAQRESNYVSN